MKKIELLKKSNNKDDIELLKQFMMNGKGKTIEVNDITDFFNADKVYPCTNERLDLYIDGDLKYKRILSVTSSGDHILQAALCGAKDVVGFDINRFCKYYSALKVAMIKFYTFDEFRRNYEHILEFSSNFGSINMKYGALFPCILNGVSKYLTKEEKKFWNTFVKLVKKGANISYFFHEIDNYGYHNNNSWYNKTNYEELKNNLINNSTVSYIDSNINNLKNKVVGDFDVIFISNILERISDTDKKYDKECKEILMYLKNLLKDDGTIYNYNFCEDKIINTDLSLDYYYDKRDVTLDFDNSVSIFKKNKRS